MNVTVPNSIVLDDGTTLHNVHSILSCAGASCPIHKPSAHAMAMMPTAFMEVTKPSKFKMQARTCSHGVNHPDPDAWAYLFGQHKVNVATVHLHWNTCACKCCADGQANFITVYEQAWNFFSGFSKTFPNPQEHVLPSDLYHLLELVYVASKRSHLMRTALGKGSVLKDRVDLGAVVLTNPRAVRTGVLPQSTPCFEHYPSGFTATWHVSLRDGTATCSQAMDAKTFHQRVYQPIIESSTF